MYESILYFDPQSVQPAQFCPRCGGECYAPSLICIRCERKEIQEDKKKGLLQATAPLYQGVKFSKMGIQPSATAVS